MDTAYLIRKSDRVEDVHKFLCASKPLEDAATVAAHEADAPVYDSFISLVWSWGSSEPGIMLFPASEHAFTYIEKRYPAFVSVMQVVAMQETENGIDFIPVPQPNTEPS